MEQFESVQHCAGLAVMEMWNGTSKKIYGELGRESLNDKDGAGALFFSLSSLINWLPSIQDIQSYQLIVQIILLDVKLSLSKPVQELSILDQVSFSSGQPRNLPLEFMILKILPFSPSQD